MSDCILWTGRLTPKGYGKVGTNGIAHRVAFEQAHGPIPEGMQIHHVCRVRACINPDHLVALTHLEHSHEHRLDVCRAGLHPLTPENVYIRATGARSCRPCRTLYARRFRARKATA